VNGYRGPIEKKMRERLEQISTDRGENWQLLLGREILILTLFTRTAYTNAY
jgi:hypothetical protein